jgi:uncharacterized membrane protein
MRILFIGETMILVSTEIIGNVTLETAAYLDESSFPLRRALESEHAVVHLPVHEVPAHFPTQASELDQYDVVILSDVGAGIFLEGSPHDGIDRLDLLCAWVAAGGGLVMVGGFLSFSGMEGKARWGATALEALLPVDMAIGDDRREAPRGARPVLRTDESEGLAALLEDCPPLLGWNSTTAKTDATVVAEIGDEPLLALRRAGKGRTAAFTSDCGPHWGSDAFLAWKGYAPFWLGLVKWLADGR